MHGPAGAAADAAMRAIREGGAAKAAWSVRPLLEDLVDDFPRAFAVVVRGGVRLAGRDSG